MKKIIPIVSSFIVFSLIWYFLMPTMNFWFAGVWFAVIIGSIIFAASSINISNLQVTLAGVLATSILVIFLLLGLITTSEIFNSADYRAVLGNIKEANFTQDISPVNPSQIRIVDADMARKLGEKKLGEDPGLGSRVEIGVFEIQKIKDQLYWVAPLEHNGYFVWFNHSSVGTPGYIQVSATNPDDIKMVQIVNEKKISIKYQPGAYFTQDLSRHIYLNGYMTKGFTDMTFEVDDDGKPFWVVTLYDHKVGFSGADVTGILTVDPETGEINEYSMDKIPNWIDRVQPESFIYTQVNYWGEYIHGYWNTVFSKQDILKSSSIPDESGNHTLRLIYGDNGKSYWYSGLTSTGADRSTVGFLLVDSRTKEVFRYNVSGATESGAESSAEGAVQAAGYNATSFIPYNLSGYVSYIGPLKDAGGLIKGVAIVNMQNYNIVGWGENITEAIRSYKGKLASTGNAALVNSLVDRKTFDGIIERFVSDTKAGNTAYFMIVSSHDGYIFRSDSSSNPKLPLTKVGDKVKISYTETGTGLVDIDDFDNLSINLKLSESEEKKLSEVKSVKKEKRVIEDEKELDSQIQKMTPEEKTKLLESVKKK